MFVGLEEDERDLCSLFFLHLGNLNFCKKALEEEKTKKSYGDGRRREEKEKEKGREGTFFCPFSRFSTVLYLQYYSRSVFSSNLNLLARFLGDDTPWKLLQCDGERETL